MCIFIGMEDLVSNALIELIERNQCRRVDFETLIEYGNVVVKILKNNDKEAVLLLTKENTNNLIRNYSDVFTIGKEGEEYQYIELKEGKTVKDLRQKFRAYLSLELLLAFVNENSLKKLNIK